MPFLSINYIKLYYMIYGTYIQWYIVDYLQYILSLTFVVLNKLETSEEHYLKIVESIVNFACWCQTIRLLPHW